MRSHSRPNLASDEREHRGISKIISGGQTGVDRAALDVAIDLGIPHGGWCPKGRIAEDGPISLTYQLREMASPDYVERTRKNVLEADGTLILYSNKLEGGTFLTANYAEKIGRPCLKIRLSNPGSFNRLQEWIVRHKISVLNVAGPRSSKEPTIYQKATKYLQNAIVITLSPVAPNNESKNTNESEHDDLNPSS